MKKYELQSKEQNPNFRYLVKKDINENYSLFNDFDKAYNMMKVLDNACILEPIFAPINREWKMKRTFTCKLGKVDYLGNSGDILLHTKFYCDAGECVNYDLFIRGLT